MVHRIEGDHVPLPQRVADFEYSIGITAGWPQVRERKLSPASVLRGLYRMTAPWRPRFIVSNFRSGPATWLAFAGLARGWDVRGVISLGQPEGSNPTHRVHLLELMESCDYVVCPSPELRDLRVREMVDVMLDVGDIAAMRLPKLDAVDVRSEELVDAERSAGDGHAVAALRVQREGPGLPRGDASGAEGARTG